jgi:hypothetical protein
MKMKRKLYSGILAVLFVAIMAVNTVKAQDEEKESPFSLGADFVSSYVWRGSRIGTGPNIQPSLKYTTGGLTVGAWGSHSFHPTGDVSEADLYALYAFDFGLSAGITDYYYQGFPYFQYAGDTASHAFEINLGYAIKSLSFSANYIVNDASNGGPANKPGGGDLYFEADYAFKHFTLIAGAGNGWHSTDKDNGDDIFAVCNLGIKATKEIKVTDTFAIPVFGAFTVNPDKEEMNLVVGFSF